MRHFETRLDIRSYELDAFGHVNHAVYLNYFEQARFEALEQGDFSLASLGKKGWGIHVVRVEVDYRRELRLGDGILIRTWVEEWRKTSMLIGQDARHAESGDLVAEAKVTAVWIGPDRRPMRIPPEARQALS